MRFYMGFLISNISDVFAAPVSSPEGAMVSVFLILVDSERFNGRGMACHVRKQNEMAATFRDFMYVFDTCH